MTERTHREKMLYAIRMWLINIEDYPGWKEWRLNRISHTLHFDDPYSSYEDSMDKEFHFSEEIKNQHDLIMKYLMLLETINSAKDCEYYFRRYPFRGLPVTRANHITNICEMFFGRFYEFKERLKNYFRSLEEVCPNHNLDIGKFIKLFEREFRKELKYRNISIHHRRFEDIEIDRIFLRDMLKDNIKEDDKIKELARGIFLREYRRVSNIWVQRVRQRSAMLDEFLEAIAQITLKRCKFLSDLSEKKPSYLSDSE